MSSPPTQLLLNRSGAGFGSPFPKGILMDDTDWTLVDFGDEKPKSEEAEPRKPVSKKRKGK
ncbi:hypothetical protein GCM10008943_30850 [Paenochrobactrum glaciei]|uniref:Uncharacterized protein n=1 Tax=Paenochrobactrum glaciei TaxID=486407 RepID=A0ABP3RMQ3_9HYPH